MLNRGCFATPFKIKKMAVLRSKRHESSVEFVFHMNKIKKFVSKIFIKISKRKRECVCGDFQKNFEDIYNKIQILNNGHNKFSDIIKYNMGLDIINDIQNMQISYDTLCMGAKLKKNKRITLSNMLNHEIDSMYKYIEKNRYFNESDRKYIYIIFYDYPTINRVEYIRNCMILQDLINSIVVDAKRSSCLLEKILLRKNINKALSFTISANRIYPRNREEYLKRLNYIDVAISCIHSLNDNFRAIFDANDFSERRIRNVCKTLTRTVDSLNGIRKSDKSRFGKLK